MGFRLKNSKKVPGIVLEPGDFRFNTDILMSNRLSMFYHFLGILNTDSVGTSVFLNQIIYRLICRAS
jgi:hypothetical protein